MIIHVQEIKETRTVKLKKSVNMHPKKPANDMWLKKPTTKDKNCQVTMHNKK